MPEGINTLRKLASLVEALDATETLKDRLDLRNELLSIQKDVMDLQIANDELIREKAKLREQLDRRKKLEYIDGSYYVMLENKMVGPICPQCYRDKDIINPLHNGYCSVCKTRYAIKESGYVSTLERMSWQ